MPDLRLVELEPEWLKREDDTHFRRASYVDNVAQADGIVFLCPKCFLANGRQRPGVHGVICWQPRVPQTTAPIPGRWELVGTGFDNLTLRAGSSSVALQGGCQAHFFIEEGVIRMC